jgi:Ca2+-binding RTX toxin-like protein
MPVIVGTNTSETLNGGAEADIIFGLGGDDTLNGQGGDDVLDGGTGDDTIFGNDGADTAFLDLGTGGSDTIDLGDGLDTVLTGGSNGQIRLTFTSSEVGNGNGNDSVAGGLNVRLQGEDGADALTGPQSRIDDEGVTFVAAAGQTFDVRDTGGAQRGDRFEVVSLGTMGADVMTAAQASRPYYFNAGMGNDSIRGGDADDFLVGGAGNDTLNGGNGADSYLGGGGNDTIDSIDRPSNIFGASVAPVRDTVDAGDGDDTVTGGRLDQLQGGAGDDFLLLNFNFNGPVAGSAPAVTLTLDANGSGVANDGTSIAGFERMALFLTDNADVVNTGNVTMTSLDGGGGDDVLTTGSGNDVVNGGAGNDIISTGGGNDTITGGDGDDTIDGGEGDDSLTVNLGSGGSDTVNLGTGNDTVRFDGAPGQVRVTFTSSEVGNGNANDGNAMTNQDGGLAVRIQAEDGTGNLVGAVSRYDDEGITFIAGTQGIFFDVRDLVSGAQRGDAFEGVVLGTSGDDNLSFFPPFRINQSFYYNAGMGNDIVLGGNADDFLVGGGGNDTLTGGGGNDSFLGGGGNDTLFGGDGNDRLEGGAGNDAMTGGAGDDFYFVDSGDTVIEGAAEGTGDRVFASTSYTLTAGAYIENLATDFNDGTAAIDLSGNELDNLIYGNAGDNDIDGRGGADTMVGFGGNDFFFVDNAGDRIVENSIEGTGDRVFASTSYTLSAGAHIENMSTDFHAGTAAIDLSGNELGNLIYGNAGSNVLDGKQGNDTLVGFGGADTFAFTTALGAGNVDLVFDFGADDVIALDDAVFTGLSLGSLSASAFTTGPAATTADQRIVYNQATGQLFYDADGNGVGAQMLFATLQGSPILTASDFTVI